MVFDSVDESGEVEETYYEIFDTPEQARRVFRDAFPEGDETISNARLAVLVCDIDDVP